jgi:hypothetical protein
MVQATADTGSQEPTQEAAMTLTAAIIATTEDQGRLDSAMPAQDLLDRVELIAEDQDRVKLLRRIYNDRDLFSVFRLTAQEDLRKAVLEQNTHSLFRLLEQYDLRSGDFQDLRRAALEQNLHSLFRLLASYQCGLYEHEDLRRAVVESNLHSVFRLLQHNEPVQGDWDDLRKAVTEQNLHSVFRLLQNHSVVADLPQEDLRKAVLDQNLHSIFRIFQNANIERIDADDLRKAVLDQNLHSVFRLFEDCDDLRKAVLEQNLHSVFRLFVEVEPLRKAVLNQDIRAIFSCYTAIDDDTVALDDLRKTVCDQNLHSLFRMFDGVDDLRKAVIDQNMISVFRLSGEEDLPKFVLNDHRPSMYRLLGDYCSSQLIPAVKKLEEQQTVFYQDSLSRGQIKSKLWIIDQLRPLELDLGCVFICAGWYATLSMLLFESGLKITKIRSFDIDESCVAIAEIFNKPWVIDQWRFKASTHDILDLNYSTAEYSVTKNDGSKEQLYDSPDTVINTSCEHIGDFDVWYSRIPLGKLVILQNNNYYEIADHVNCCQDLEQFAQQSPMAQCLYQGELDLGNYKRFMRIGYR